MTAPLPMDDRVEALGKASRQAAALGMLGLLLVLVAIGTAYTGLRTIERQRVAIQKERDALALEIGRNRQELAAVRAELGRSRAALSAARAAINAFHAGRLEDAVGLYDEVLEADPDNAYIQNLRAYSLFRLGRVEAAIEGQRRSLSADPTYAWGYFDLARFLYAAAPPQVEEARRAEAKAIELRPDMRAIMQSDGEFQRVRRRAQG
jgi:tetratricopeptide (TPR) repeat protein